MMPESRALCLFLILVGPAVGSLLAVVVDRLPRGEDVVGKRSFCRACGTGLSHLQMLPLVSFALQRGRCQTCGQGIPAWLLYMELLALIAAVLAVIAGETIAEVILGAVLLWLLLALAVGDVLWFRLPDVLTAALALTAFGLAVLPGGIGWVPTAWGALAGAGSFALLRWGYALLRGREGLGLGDVKLMVGIGAFVGVYDLPLVILIAAIGALIAALVGRVRDPASLDAQRELPFGTALCAATALMWLIGPVLSPMAG